MHHHNSPCRPHRCCAGFTLIELMATLSIMAIIGAFALPAFDDMIGNIRAGMAADKLYHHLYFARTEAITKNMTTTVCASRDGLSCHHGQDWSDATILVFRDHNGNGNIDGRDTVVRSLDLGLDRNSLTWRSFGNKPYLQWLPTGMTYFQNGNFTYCPRNNNVRQAKKIILNAAGRVYFGEDRNRDGIQEGTDGKNIRCPAGKAA